MLDQMSPQQFVEFRAADILEQERSWEPAAMIAANVHNAGAWIVLTLLLMEPKAEFFVDPADLIPRFGGGEKPKKPSGKRRLTAQEAEQVAARRFGPKG